MFLFKLLPLHRLWVLADWCLTSLISANTTSFHILPSGTSTWLTRVSVVPHKWFSSYGLTSLCTRPIARATWVSSGLRPVTGPYAGNVHRAQGCTSPSVIVDYCAGLEKGFHGSAMLSEDSQAIALSGAISPISLVSGCLRLR